MEEIQARKVVNPSGTSRDGLDEEGDTLSIIIHEKSKPKSYSTGCHGWKEEKLKSLDKMDEEIRKEGLENYYQNPRIQRIPVILHGSKNMEYYAPRVISIGPLHHGDSKFEVTERLKLKLTTLFVNEHDIQRQDLYEKIESRIGLLKNCYVEEEINKFNDQELTWMFLVDGCSTLHYIDYAANRKMNELKIKKDQMAFGHHDIFLLENQLPYELLQLIMDSCQNGKSEKLIKSIYNFIQMNVQETRGGHQLVQGCDTDTTPYEEAIKSKSMRPTHLLDLFRTALIQESSLKSDQERNNTSAATKPKLKKKEEIQNGWSCSGSVDELKNGWSCFRSVNELMNAGIEMKPLPSGSLTNIYFNYTIFGTLHLPTLMVDDSTAPKFLNLIAYEMCPDFFNDFEVTSYICFLDNLIDLPADVEELRHRKVLLNNLGSDKHVAELFNSISTNMVPNDEIYRHVKREIQKYYDVKWTTWIAQGFNNHFSTPWTIMAFIAVVSELAMSFIQTFYAIKDKK